LEELFLFSPSRRLADVKAWLENNAPNRFLNRFGLCVPRSFHRPNGPKMNSVSRRWAIGAANTGS
jgi:hypothetical protein